MSGHTNWWQIFAWGAAVAVAVLLIHQLREPWESAIAIAVAWMVGLYFMQKKGRNDG